MSADQSEHVEEQDVVEYRPLRIWPALILLAVLAAARFLPSRIDDLSITVLMTAFFSMLGSQSLLVLWWLLASRATWRERLVGVAGLAILGVVTLQVVHESMIGPGMMMVVFPACLAAFSLGAILLSQQPTFRRTIVALVLAACALSVTSLLRNDGMWGDFALDLHWRFTPSSEDQLVADSQTGDPANLQRFETPEVEAALAAPDWPAFRGPQRDGRQRGSQLATDWSTQPPEQLWKIAVGPGWSSFVVAGNLLYTQEQRGPQEAVVCYDANTGDQLWIQQYESRFSDPLGGPGPRATPTLADGALYVMGGEGLLARLDPKSGDILWQQDLRDVAAREPPTWGFSSSPLVVGNSVIVYAGGAGDRGTLAFDTETGELRWSAPAGDHAYCSPQLNNISGTDYVVVLSNAGLDLLDPNSGDARFNYDWQIENYRALQPQVFASSDLLVPSGLDIGIRRLTITSEDGNLAANDLWTTRHLDPDFNDFVVHDGHAYGFDGLVFACIDLEKGKRQWKRGRYGKGQVLLLEDSGLLLVISEFGEIVLLRASPEKHEELAKVPALEGRTWNHPVLVGDRLYIRNSQEAACYRLPLAAEQGADSMAAG